MAPKMICSRCGTDCQDAPCVDGSADSHTPVWSMTGGFRITGIPDPDPHPLTKAEFEDIIDSRAADFELANRAFVLMTLAERETVLEEFAQLQYPSIRDRFVEAVFLVIQGHVVTDNDDGLNG